MPNDKELYDLIEITSERIDLHQSIIEKDYYVTQADKINDLFFSLANDIILNDAGQFKNQHPEYFSDPSTEIKESIRLLKSKTIWKERYQEFIATMVYDNTESSGYDIALNALENISLKAIALIPARNDGDLLNLAMA